MDYFKSPAISQSMIKLLLKNRKTFYYKYILKQYEDAETQALKEGKAFDLLLTEPENFTKEFTILEGVKTTTKPKHITDYQYNKMLGMKKELLNYKDENNITIREIFKNGTYQEELYWNDEYSWLDCRAKLDWISNDKKTIIDIKTTSSIDGIKWDMFSYGYDIQAAMYTRAIKQLYNIDADFIFLFVSKSSPYNVARISLSPETLLEATRKLEYGFDLYNEYMISNEWQYDDNQVIIV